MGSKGIHVALPPALLAVIDEVIAETPKRLTRPQAIRDLVEEALRAKGKLAASAAPAETSDESSSIGQRLLDAAKEAAALVKAKIPGAES